MNILSGVLAPDEGQILINGEPVTLRNPKHALSYGIGVVHQHSRLVEALTAGENLFVGWNGSGRLGVARSSSSAPTSSRRRTNLSLDMGANVWQLSVADKQRLEILRTLSRGGTVLILDEPTAVLTPSETGGSSS